MQWPLNAGNKKPGTSFKWSLIALYRWSLYREKFDLKTLGKATTWSLWTGGLFKKVIVKTDLTVATKEAKANMEIHSVIVEITISK